MEGGKWDALFNDFAHRLDAQRRREEDERSLMLWYDEQTKLVMLLVREVAQERAQAFERATGRHVEVTWPSRPPINVVPEGPFMSFMSVALGEREIQLYSHRLHSAAPAIHYVVVGGKRAVSERKRLMSYAGCRIERRVTGGFALVAGGETGERRELSADDVAFRAFELLLSNDP
jgi:hypothetical protein